MDHYAMFHIKISRLLSCISSISEPIFVLDSHVLMHILLHCTLFFRGGFAVVLKKNHIFFLCGMSLRYICFSST